MYEKLGAIINRLPNESIIPLVDTNGIPVLSYIENDGNLAAFDIQGKSILDLPENSNVVRGARTALEKLGIL